MQLFTARALALVFAVLGIVAALTLPAAAGAAGEHDHGGHGGGAPVQAADADRCDLGFNTKAYNDRARMQQTGLMTPSWSETFLRHNYRQMWRYNWSQITNYWFNYNISKHMYDGMVKQPNPHLHPLTDHWNSITNPVVCNKLKGQLNNTRDFAAQYPTLGDATDDGFTFVTPWFAGAGTHMGRWELLDGEVDPANPEVLIYDGNGKEARLVGVMYAVLSNERPKDVFVGGNDVWHQHRGLCFTSSQRAKEVFQPMERMVIGSERAEKIWCEQMWGGEKDDFASLWMMHVWVVPGCENDWGLFAHDHPYLTVHNSVVAAGKPWYRGCGKNLAPTTDLRMETDELNVRGPLTTYESSQLSWSEGGAPVASGPVAAELDDHPGEAHAGGEMHLTGTLKTEEGFSGPAGTWNASIVRKGDVIRGTITTPAGTAATFESAEAERSDCGVHLTATSTTGVALDLDICDPGLRGWFLDAMPTATETLKIAHPAHGHAHAEGPVTYAFAAHPGGAHGPDEEHMTGTITTLDGFTGPAGTWQVSLLKNTTTNAITGYLVSPDGTKTFDFTVEHHEDAACEGGVTLHATGAERATPTDPQNPEMTICDPDVAAFFAGHEHTH